MSTQERFVPQATAKDAHIDELYRRIDNADNLEYAVLLAHVVLADQLVDLLGLRLRTDTLPAREPSFDTLVGLALAGSRYSRDRLSLTALARARNTIAHRVDRTLFARHVEEFTRGEWVEDPAVGFSSFVWPDSEVDRLKAFAWSFRALTLRLYAYHEEYQASFPGV